MLWKFAQESLQNRKNIKEGKQVMTVQELYELAKEKNALDYSIEVFHSDDGGFYFGSRDVDMSEIEINNDAKKIIM